MAYISIPLQTLPHHCQTLHITTYQTLHITTPSCPTHLYLSRLYLTIVRPYTSLPRPEPIHYYLVTTCQTLHITTCQTSTHHHLPDPYTSPLARPLHITTCQTLHITTCQTLTSPFVRPYTSLPPHHLPGYTHHHLDQNPYTLLSRHHLHYKAYTSLPIARPSTSLPRHTLQCRAYSVV